ncbi:MAG: sn-glycerol-3-phosphate ABC transporter ATP-binding protein UgpC [Dehalococcoidia bacterium]|nr:sn-glycerol-3-phosphate ABC transporter ATP-binding protein UgpC [Dehalococcoidia bacterium]
MARVLFDHVTKRFGEVVAVNDLNLEVTDGEFLVLVGPSGCGKSTTLRMLAGLDAITEGSIYIGDRRVDNVPAKDRDLAMVFQSYALYPHMSVGDNIGFGLKLRGASKSQVRERVERAAETLGIEELLERKPRALSGGQRQRVALGRAIVREPEVFLLDEPLSNLDAKLRVQTRTEISKLHRRLGTTFVYVTHDQVEAMTMATRIAVLNLGLLQQVGPPQELYERPANVFVAGFIGSPSMNFFQPVVRSEGETLRLDMHGLSIEVPARWVPGLLPYDGRPIVLGVRPEHIHDPAYLPSGVLPASIRATVDVTELMGNETFLHLDREGTRFLARVDPRTQATPAQEAEVVIDVSRMHAFDPETEQRIEAQAAPAEASGTEAVS